MTRVVDLPGLVVLSAAEDGSDAIERWGRGVFTDALVEILADHAGAGLTYWDLERQLVPLVMSASPQRPNAEGDLRRHVLGAERRERPLVWSVLENQGEALVIGGVALAGTATGAELLVFDSSSKGEDLKDPLKSKASVRVQSMLSPTRARAEFVSRGAGVPVNPGDLVMTARRGEAASPLRLVLNRRVGAEGFTDDEIVALEKLLLAHAGAHPPFVTVREDADLELDRDGVGDYVLRDRLGVARSRWRSRDATSLEAVGSLASKALLRLSRQRELLALAGNGGWGASALADHRTLVIEVRRSARESLETSESHAWDGRSSLDTQEVEFPDGEHWDLYSSLAASAPAPVLVGGAILSSDGAIIAVPRAGREVRLYPGGPAQKIGSFRAQPPYHVADHLILFATNVDNPVDWTVLEDDDPINSVRRSGRRTGTTAFFHRVIGAPAEPLRGGGDDVGMQGWTVSHMSVRVAPKESATAAAP